MSNDHQLLFVYGNDSGTVNGLLHYVHKIVSPSTYDCRLCGLTYGPLGQRAAWTNALADLAVGTSFLHRDEMIAKHGNTEPLPAIFLVDNERPAVLITKQEIETCADLGALIALLRSRVPAVPKRARA